MLECYGLDAEEDVAALGSWPQFEGINWLLGRPIEKTIPTPILIELDPDNPGLMMPMFDSGVLLFNDEMISVLHKIGVTNFQCYDAIVRDTENDIDFTKKLVLEYGVATIPLSPFYADAKQTKCIRFCFAKDEKTLLEATNRLLKL